MSPAVMRFRAFHDRAQERGQETQPRYTVIDKVARLNSPDDADSAGAVRLSDARTNTLHWG